MNRSLGTVLRIIVLRLDGIEMFGVVVVAVYADNREPTPRNGDSGAYRREKTDSTNPSSMLLPSLTINSVIVLIGLNSTT